MTHTQMMKMTAKYFNHSLVNKPNSLKSSLLKIKSKYSLIPLILRDYYMVTKQRNFSNLL